jgi:phosphoglucomutase
VKRAALDRARSAATAHRHDFLQNYVRDLARVIDMDVLRSAKRRMGVDPLGAPASIIERRLPTTIA